jgi:hypothetical protein
MFSGLHGLVTTLTAAIVWALRVEMKSEQAVQGGMESWRVLGLWALGFGQPRENSRTMVETAQRQLQSASCDPDSGYCYDRGSETIGPASPFFR